MPCLNQILRFPLSFAVLLCKMTLTFQVIDPDIYAFMFEFHSESSSIGNYLSYCQDWWFIRGLCCLKHNVNSCLVGNQCVICVNYEMYRTIIFRAPMAKLNINNLLNVILVTSRQSNQGPSWVCVTFIYDYKIKCPQPEPNTKVKCEMWRNLLKIWKLLPPLNRSGIIQSTFHYFSAHRLRDYCRRLQHNITILVAESNYDWEWHRLLTQGALMKTLFWWN